MSDMEKPAETAAAPQAPEQAPQASEQAEQATLAEQTEQTEQTEQASQTEPAPAGRPVRAVAVKVTAAVTAAVLVGVGIGFGIIKANGDDTAKTAPAAALPAKAVPTASAKPSYGALSSGAHFGSMRDLLLPVPAGYTLGPDDGVYGDDTQLTKDQMSSFLDDLVSYLPKDERDKAKAALQAEDRKNVGVRSYRQDDNMLVATIQLQQFDVQAVKETNAFQAVLGTDSGAFRQGPGVPGYPSAACYLPQADPNDPVDAMQCTAGIGDLLVTMNVQGVAPLPKSVAVSIFRQQLERLAIPGASV
jgi:F0F1-type ATP synthase assembly protein I